MACIISKKIYNSNLASIYFDANSLNKKIKIIVKKKDYPLAVDRNKIKRRVREIFKQGYKSNGYVVVIGPGFLKKGYEDISIVFKGALDNFLNKVKDN